MFDERMINIFESLKIPNTYWKNKSYEYQYWFRSLLQKIDSALVFKGLPESWPQDYFLFCLWAFGYVAIFKSERFGDEQSKAAFATATVSQYDFYYQPVKALVSNPLFVKEFTIHKDCEILKLTPDCYWKGGCLDIIAWYAQRLAELTKAIDMGVINAKVPMIGYPNDTAAAQRLKALYDKIQAGETLALLLPDETGLDTDEIIPPKEPFYTWQNELKNNYIVTELLQNMQCVLNQFYMEIGLPTILDDKKAHTLNAEADFQSAQSQARIACWVQTLNESFEKINPMFGLELEVEYAQRNEDETVGSGELSEQDK